MSEAETRALVDRLLSAFNAGDHETMLALFADDVAHDVNYGERSIGREALRWSLGRMALHFRAELADIAVMTAPGGVRAAAEFTLHTTYRASVQGWPEARGQRTSRPVGLFLEVDGGRISRLTLCLDAEALKADLDEGPGA